MVIRENPGLYEISEQSGYPLKKGEVTHSARTEEEAIRVAHMLLKRRSKSEFWVEFNNIDGTVVPVGTLDDRGWHPTR